MDVILDGMQHLLERFFDTWLSPIWTDGTYRLGFLRGVFITVTVGFLGGWIIEKIQSARAKIAAFFQPSALPATRPGPSGYDRASGCGRGTLTLFFVFICILMFIVTLIVALFH